MSLLVNMCGTCFDPWPIIHVSVCLYICIYGVQWRAENPNCKSFYKKRFYVARYNGISSRPGLGLGLDVSLLYRTYFTSIY